MGRPPELARRRARSIAIRVSEEEWSLFQSAAAARGLQASSWARMVMRDAARVDLAEYGAPGQAKLRR